jgi:hypothetical protein
MTVSKVPPLGLMFEFGVTLVTTRGIVSWLVVVTGTSPFVSIKTGCHTPAIGTIVQVIYVALLEVIEQTSAT